MYETVTDERIIDILNKRYLRGDFTVIGKFSIFSCEISDLLDRKGYVYRRVFRLDRVFWLFPEKAICDS
jgi:hypothetical protein